MIDQAAAMEMRRILTDPKLMVFLQAQEDEYGTPRLGETLRKIEYGTEIARSFGFDEALTLAIQTIHDLSLPCFGVVGEEFLRAVDPDYTRAMYGRRPTWQSWTWSSPSSTTPDWASARATPLPPGRKCWRPSTPAARRERVCFP